MEAARRILIVEDEPAIADALVYALRTEGFAPVHCLTGGAGWTELVERAPALVVLDVGLPDGNGFDFCRRARAAGVAVPILFLTAREAEVDRIVGLEIGADDYVTKPFSPREVVARVRAILRRGAAVTAGNGEGGGEGKRAGRWTWDVERCVVTYRGVGLELTRYEWRLLATLLSRPGRVWTREALMAQAWEDPGASLDRTVDAHVKMVRAKLRAIAAEAEPIRTVRGLGYALDVEA